MERALQRWGTMTWEELIAPSVELVEFGLPIDWFASQKIAQSARELMRYPTNQAVYLPEGLPPVLSVEGVVNALPLKALAQTYRRLKQTGPEDLYQGQLAQWLVAGAEQTGAEITERDLDRYEVQLFTSEPFIYQGAKIWAPVGLNAGPSLRRALALLEKNHSHSSLSRSSLPGPEVYIAYAEVLQQAYRERLEKMGASETGDPGATTHLGVIDRGGNIVSWTQTVMPAFGSKVVFPRTGLTMNNAMMWFDPRPNRPSSISPGVHPLSNMCPTIVERADGLRFAIGACGGRRIFPAVFQLIAFLVDYSLELDEAMHLPRYRCEWDEYRGIG